MLAYIFRLETIEQETFNILLKIATSLVNPLNKKRILLFGEVDMEYKKNQCAGTHIYHALKHVYTIVREVEIGVGGDGRSHPLTRSPPQCCIHSQSFGKYNVIFI